MKLLSLSQQDWGPSRFAEARWTCPLLCAFWRIILATLKLGDLLSYIKGCSNGRSKHVLRNLRQIKVALIILWERMSICVPVPGLCFLEGLYRTDDIVTIVSTKHPLTFFYNDNRPKGCKAIIMVKGSWQVTILDYIVVCPINLSTSRIVGSN